MPLSNLKFLVDIISKVQIDQFNIPLIDLLYTVIKTIIRIEEDTTPLGYETLWTVTNTIEKKECALHALNRYISLLSMTTNVMYIESMIESCVENIKNCRRVLFSIQCIKAASCIELVFV